MFTERLPRTYELQFLDEAQKKGNSEPANSFTFEENLLNIYYFVVQLYYRTDYDLWFFARNWIRSLSLKICQIITTEFSLYLANFLWLQLKPKIVIRRISY